jgi:two-component system response regulator HydG
LSKNASTASDVSNAGETSKPRILIVDDEPSIRSALERWFNIRGFVADQAADGMEALEKIQQAPFDIITMDLDMPRMSGIEAIARIREMQPEIPIVVLTGFIRDTAIALNNGATRVLTKPVRLRELEEEVRRLLAGLR